MGPGPVAVVSGLVGGCALAAAAPLGDVLGRCKHGRRAAVESLTGGISLAYVVLDLLVEVTIGGGEAVHKVVQFGPHPVKALFAVVLAGAVAWQVVAALATAGGRARPAYAAILGPQFVYRVFVGGALALEAEHGVRSLLLFAVPMLLHLSVEEARESHELTEYSGPRRAVMAFAPALGSTGWVVFDVPEDALFFLLAIVAGSTFVQIVRNELPAPPDLRVGPFLAGVATYSLFVGMRWAGG